MVDPELLVSFSRHWILSKRDYLEKGKGHSKGENLTGGISARAETA